MQPRRVSALFIVLAIFIIIALTSTPWHDESNGKFDPLGDATEHTAPPSFADRNRKLCGPKRGTEDFHIAKALDAPRHDDEEQFCFLPKSRGGILSKPVAGKNRTVPASPLRRFQLAEIQEQNEQAAFLHKTMIDVYDMFALYDMDETSDRTMPVYGTMCVGVDCEFIPAMFANLKIGIGHIIVVINTEDYKWVHFFAQLERQFPGRFSKYHRPQKLSCAESWNLVVRQAFSIRPMIDQVFIANADWHPKPTPKVENNMARFCEWSRTVLHLPLNRYYHFSSFAFTKKGYLELGYFDENIYPALAEDVEFHIKAVSKGLGELGLYDNWGNGSVHRHRASASDSHIVRRSIYFNSVDYILRKWGCRFTDSTDMVNMRPYKTPFGLHWMRHENSWAVDPVHRRCLDTGRGPKMLPDQLSCFYDPHALKQQGLVPRFFIFPERMTTLWEK